MAGAVDFQLQGKRALVFGSTAGIGFAIARELAAEAARASGVNGAALRVDGGVVRAIG